MTERDHQLEGIAREQWEETCERFLNRHRGWLVRILETPGGGPTQAAAKAHCDQSYSAPQPRELVSDLALHDLVFAESGGVPELTLVVGDSAGKETGLTVRPQAVLLERRGEADAGIRFVQRDGDQIRVLFRVPAVPEALDGLAQGEL